MLGLGILTLTLALIPRGIVAIVYSLSDWSVVRINIQAIVSRILAHFPQFSMDEQFKVFREIAKNIVNTFCGKDCIS